MDTVVPQSIVASSDLERVARLLASAPAPQRWAFEHRHAPLLCALGIVEAPDTAYARAVGRRFADPSELRARAVALLAELDRETRAHAVARRRVARQSSWAARLHH